LELLDVALEAARAGAAVIRDATAQREKLVWETKSRSDFVSEVDKASEQRIAEIVRRRCPHAIVLGEELSPGAISSEGIVVIADPLDGTTNFLHGYPQYAVSIGCGVSGVLCAGVVHDVVRNLVYRASAGGGAWVGEQRLAVSGLTQPKRSLVGTGFPFKNEGLLDAYLRQFAAVMGASSGIRRAGSAALDLADLAAGRFDAFWELSLAPWDIAAGVVLVREAGGRVTRLDGSEDVLGQGAIVAGNPALHRWLIDLLRST